MWHRLEPETEISQRMRQRMTHQNDLADRSSLQDARQPSVNSRVLGIGVNTPTAHCQLPVAYYRLHLRPFAVSFVVILPLLLLLAACASPTPTPKPAEVATIAPISLPTPSQDWPPILVPSDNPITPAKVELGRQLFYDPILSASKAMSCATCHHPDHGLSNGQTVSIPRQGAPPRNVPALWNVGFNRFIQWDGSEQLLESQAWLPLTLPNEMAIDPAEVKARLRAIPAYVELFDAAFGGNDVETVTFDNVTRALAAFQRTLISQNSAYDRYVAGDSAALTAQQQRGMALFFSERTHCAECHQPPLFALENFRVTGIPSDDLGRAAVSEKGIKGAFKVPTLRNVTLSAPYMHNAALATLDEAVQFYADGAGRANDFPLVDPLLKGFDLTAQEKADLVAFLNALTDESQLPPVPEVTLSGLPVVKRTRK